MPDVVRFNQMLETLVNNVKHRQIIFWTDDEWLRNALATCGFFPKSILTYDQQQAICMSESESSLKELKEHYYLIFPSFLENIEDIEKRLIHLFGCRETKDYFVFACKPFILTQIDEAYTDEYKNYIAGTTKNVMITMKGCNNKINIGGETVDSVSNLKISCEGSGNSIYIKENCRFWGNNIISIRGQNCKVIIGAGTCLHDTSLRFAGESSLSIGEKCILGSKTLFQFNLYSDVKIGKECIFSTGTILQTGDGHAIFDLHTGKNINCSESFKNTRGYLYSIHLEDHIWIGRNVLILGSVKEGTTVGRGTVISAYSMLKGRFPNNVILSGTPARVQKRDISWSSSDMSDHFETCKEYTDFTEEYLAEI